MQVKKAGGKVYGAVLTAAEKKAMDLEIQRELAEYDRKHIAEIDATILWVLHEQFGFGAQRLRTYYDAFHDRIKELVSRYEMEDQDDIWLCTQMLKRIGVDVEAWHKDLDISPAELSAIECGRKPVPDWFVSKLQEKYGISDMHAQSLIKFMKERGDSDCPGTTEKTQRDILTRPPIRP